MGFNLNITDSAGWFSDEILDVFLEPNSKQDITFTGNIINSTEMNTIALHIQPIDHPHKKKIISILVSTTPLSLEQNISPNNFKVLKAYPNPFNPNTLIQFETNVKQKKTNDFQTMRNYFVVLDHSLEIIGFFGFFWFYNGFLDILECAPLVFLIFLGFAMLF